ncbi:peptidoglycan bridge formation glycyltransferase FemA/FemB family protein [candidate division WWE3 bacterium]|jgi:peptidoglycan pentaglycine glycine transferase (the first glycine)|nr:peptidoglycan bridge formation glycyltransferase FemA/FemB family protein [candidate division WWE3 bacterium]MBT7350334.1 peptidoglycan bridge formation glycyltransferase FemA/FemB family protein [candidate division WWE3 bacterium]
MENSKLHQIKDVRQSEGWGKFLVWAGWLCERTKNNILVCSRQSPFGRLAKVQRPLNITKKDLKQIDQICKENKCSVLKLEPSLGQNLRVLEDAGYLKSFRPLLPPATIIIDLNKSEDDLWKDISKSGKYSIRRAQREGTLTKAYKKPSAKIIKEFISLTNETKKDRKFVGAPLNDIKEKVKYFGDNTYILIVKDKDGNNLVANMYVSHQNTVWFLHGGTSTKARKTKAGYELVWQSFLYFKKEGLDFLDLEGIDDERFPAFTKTWGQFSHFKERFSKERTLFPAPYVKIYNPLIKLMTKLRRKNIL